MRRAPLASTVVALALTFGVVACGDDDKDSGYAKDANAACAKVTIADLADQLRSPDSRAQFVAATNEVADRSEKLVADLGGVKPPEDDKTTFDEMVAAFKKSAGAFRAGAAKAEAGDSAGAQADFQAASGAAEEAQAAARKLDLKRCVRAAS